MKIAVGYGNYSSATIGESIVMKRAAKLHAPKLVDRKRGGKSTGLARKTRLKAEALLSLEMNTTVAINAGSCEKKVAAKAIDTMKLAMSRCFKRTHLSSTLEPIKAIGSAIEPRALFKNRSPPMYF